jgi:hypothetical protein
MREAYGVIGSGSASRKVIEASLNDIGVKPVFILPWYGKVSDGLEAVYDWALDNDASFSVVAKDGVKDVPKALAAKATSVITVDDVDTHIVNSLKDREVSGLALVLWDQDKETYSVRIASMAIDLKLPTFELTNGMVPIVLDNDQAPAEEPEVELPDIGDASYERETLEMMPAALVKRMAKDKGFDPKSKEEAVTLLSKEPEKHQSVMSILIIFQDGTELGFDGSPEILNKIMELVVASQKPW